MVTKHSSFFSSAQRYFSQGQIHTAFSVSMLLRKHAGVQQARRCATSTQACNKHAGVQQARRRATSAHACLRNSPFTSSHSTAYETDSGSVKLSLHIRHCFRRHFPKPVLTTKCQRWNEITNAVTVYLCKDTSAILICQN